MKPIAIFRHIDCEGPGYLETVLKRYEIPFHLIAVDADQAIPENINDFSGLVFMGGSMSVNDELPWIGPELSLIRAAIDAKMPLLGHCLGGQLIAKAMGATVAPMGYREIGWHDVQVCENEFSRAWHSQLKGSFNAFHWHGERFQIPAGASRLFQSALCDNQGFFMQNTLALQFHVEMSVDMIETWANLYQDELSPGQDGVQSKTQMLENISARVAELNALADMLYRRWLDPLL